MLSAMATSTQLSAQTLNPPPNKNMKITISHDQESIDPAAVYSDEDFPEIKTALEKEYAEALAGAYPDADVVFGSDTTYEVRVTETDMDDPSEIEDDVQTICEAVFETGGFWL